MKCPKCDGEAKRLPLIFEATKTTVTTLINTTEVKGTGYDNLRVSGTNTSQNTTVTYSEEGLKAAPPPRQAFRGYSFNGGGAFFRQFGKIFKHRIVFPVLCALLLLFSIYSFTSEMINQKVEGVGGVIGLLFSVVLTGSIFILVVLALVAFITSLPEARRNNAVFRAKYLEQRAEHERMQDEIYERWQNTWKCQGCGELFVHYL